MIIYQRNFKKRLRSLRILFVTLVCLCFYTFIRHILILEYVSTALFISLSLLVVKDFSFSQDSLQITKFYFFGFIKMKWLFDKTENIKVTSSSPNFGEEFDPPSFNAWETATLGCIASILFTFFPPRVTHKKFTIESLDNSGKVIRHVQLLINKEEYGLLKTLIT
ncbi:MAG: hypothetical protein JWQ09_4912 [Segetibacter sp.]|nr:hypothetical protein [Segetibacter sp.]